MLPASVTSVVQTTNKSVDEIKLDTLRKYKKEILDKVKFCDVSQTLIACGLISKDECYEICKLPANQQMALCYQKVHDIMDIIICQKIANSSKKLEQVGGSSSSFMESQDGETQINILLSDIWKNFIAGLKCEHAHLATKVEGEVLKLAENRIKRKNSAGKLKKEDIGAPISFHHVQHSGLLTRAKSVDVVLQQNSPTRGTFPRKGSAFVIQNVPDENDPTLQEFFRRAGVCQRHLTNPVTRDIIFKFIDEHGGMDAIRREVSRRSRTSSSESNLTKLKDNQALPSKAIIKSSTNDKSMSTSTLTPSMPTVPFEPTPKPEMNVIYF